MSNKLHMYNNGDPAGLVPEEELMELTSNEDPTGGATPTVTTSSYPCIGIITGCVWWVTSNFCSTVKCTSKCGK